MASKFRLVMNSGPTAGTIYPLEKVEVSIGRDLGNDIVINDPEVSRHHTRFFLQGDNYVVEDRGSTNGTSVNGQRLLGPYNLRPGELITLGEHISFVFEMSQSDPDATVISSNYNQTAIGVPSPIQQVVPAPQPVTPPPPAPQYNQPAQPQYVAPSQPQYIPPPPPPPAPSVAYVQPSQGFAGQLPMQPEPEKKKAPIALIIVIVLVLFVICGCVITLFFMPEAWWCTLLGWLLNMMTPGVCPA
jgi:predicted component of type VI protein secretion system